MSLERMLSNLPDNYAKHAQSNNYKLLSLPALTLEDGRVTLETIRQWREIDNAQGTTLDRIGKNVGQAREGLNDADYRKWLKAKSVANFSGGEIESINKVCDILLETRYDGLQEGWTLPGDFPIPPAEAMMFLTVLYDAQRFGIPFEQVEITKTGGVKLNWQLLGKTTLQATTEGRTHAQPYPLCGTYHAGQVVI